MNRPEIIEELKRIQPFIRAGKLLETLRDIYRVSDHEMNEILRGQRAVKLKTKGDRPQGTLTMAEIVFKYKIPSPKIRKWRQGGLPFVRIESMVFIEEAKLQDWIAKSDDTCFVRATAHLLPRSDVVVAAD